MSPTSKSLSAFDGLDNRKALMDLMVRLGCGLPEELARRRRARFLQSLMPLSVNGFAGKPLLVTPCSAVEAYHLFVAIANALGVPIEVAARRLEEKVRKG